jgi:D-tyrosyl-tRNA(Tyr) deacylase
LALFLITNLEKYFLFHPEALYFPNILFETKVSILCGGKEIMRLVIQRVKEARVKIREETVGEIGRGLLVFLGIQTEDTKADVDYLVEKIIHLRIFQDGDQKFNLSVTDIGGAMLVVSQFTLLGDCRKGRRPSFSDSAPPATAQILYEIFIEKVRQSGIAVACGRFQEMMDVHLVNEGPVTFILDSRKNL